MDYYNTMYEYAKSKDISHYRLAVGVHAALFVVLRFRPINDPDLHIQIDKPIVHEGGTYLPINWGKHEDSAILESAVDATCWIRYVPNEDSKGIVKQYLYVSDGTIYPSEKAAMKGA